MLRSPGPEIVETHISTLFFAEDRVYKLAKPVELPFLRTIDADERLAAAARELELNRRFSPDVYLGTADVREMGRLVDRMIVMRRLPRDRQLAVLLRNGDATGCLRDVARCIATVHASETAVIRELDADDDRLARNWSDNFEALTPHVGSTLDPSEFAVVRELAENAVSQSQPLRARRITQGYIRDGHGDLTAEDIYCLDDGPRILDCLAFDDDLRIDDVLNDIAFLAMDVHRLAGPQAVQSLMAAYHEFTNEQHPPSLAHHYVAYRAHIRAKIACLRVEQGDIAGADLARTYHTLALHHLERARIRVIVVGGGPGVGKTLLSRRLAEHYGYVHLATDEIRHDVASVPHGQHAFASPDSGVYDPSVVDTTYAEQRRQAHTLLSNGWGVVIDASWSSSQHRAELRDALADVGAEVIEIECVLDDSVARERIAHRLDDHDDPSDATPDMVDLLRSRRDPWPEATTIDTTVSIEAVVRSAVAVVERRRG